ncbi:hypothetical protein ACN9U3_03155 [Staphylococcus caprae]|uniref:hypothetical protein n=1 Tax=Staphylococcus caprae TaxID=29380 RepID=UPI003B21F0A7
MNKFRLLAAILIILLFLLGIGAIFYGLLLISTSIAFIVLGIMLIIISVLVNQLIPNQGGGD